MAKRRKFRLEELPCGNSSQVRVWHFDSSDFSGFALVRELFAPVKAALLSEPDWQRYMKNEKTQVEILKTDAVSGKPLSGAVLEIRDCQGKVLEQWTSGQESHRITEKLTAGEKYYLYETEAPLGYRLAEPMEFRMPQKAEVLKLTLENRKRGGGKENPKDPGPSRPGQPKEPGYITAWPGENLQIRFPKAF